MLHYPQPSQTFRKLQNHADFGTPLLCKGSCETATFLVFANASSQGYTATLKHKSLVP